MTVERRLRRLAKRWMVDDRTPWVSLTSRRAYGRACWYVEVEMPGLNGPRVERQNVVKLAGSARAALRKAERLDPDFVRDHLRGV